MLLPGLRGPLYRIIEPQGVLGTLGLVTRWSEVQVAWAPQTCDCRVKWGRLLEEFALHLWSLSTLGTTPGWHGTEREATLT